MKTLEGGINDNRRQIRMSLFPMSFILFIEMHVLACLLVVSNQLFQAGIVHLARSNQHIHQCLLLHFIGPQSVFIRLHTSNIPGHDYMVNRQGLKPEIT